MPELSRPFEVEGHEGSRSLELATPNAELEGWLSSCEGWPCLFVPVWADERVYGLAFMQGKGLEIPKRPDPFKYDRHGRDEGKGGY